MKRGTVDESSQEGLLADSALRYIDVYYTNAHLLAPVKLYQKLVRVRRKGFIEGLRL